MSLLKVVSCWAISGPGSGCGSTSCCCCCSRCSRLTCAALEALRLALTDLNGTRFLRFLLGFGYYNGQHAVVHLRFDLIQPHVLRKSEFPNESSTDAFHHMPSIPFLHFLFHALAADLERSIIFYGHLDVVPRHTLKPNSRNQAPDAKGINQSKVKLCVCVCVSLSLSFSVCISLCAHVKPARIKDTKETEPCFTSTLETRQQEGDF